MIRPFGLPVVALALCAAPAQAASDHWVASWAHPLRDEVPDKPSEDLKDATVRTVVRLSLGGAKVRLRFSNAFGTAPLRIDTVHLARAIGPGSDAIDPATDRRVTFDGASEVVIPQGADYWSDPVDLALANLSAVAVTFHLPEAPSPATSQVAPRGFAFLGHGATGSEPRLPGAKPLGRIYQLAGIHVATATGGTVAALGDSITAVGGGSVDGRGRWTDVLATRLLASPRGRRTAVVNLGISGGRVAKDGTGQAAIARLDRDVLSQPGLRTVVLLEGVNDIGMLSREGTVTPESRAAVVRAIVGGYAQIVARAHDRGVRVIGATILPFGGTPTYRSDADAEADRQAVNAWIRTPGHFDAVIDFDRTMRDPAHPDRLAPAFDRGDHLHPSAAGQDAMGEAVPLDLLDR